MLAVSLSVLANAHCRRYIRSSARTRRFSPTRAQRPCERLMVLDLLPAQAQYSFSCRLHGTILVHLYYTRFFHCLQGECACILASPWTYFDSQARHLHCTRERLRRFARSQNDRCCELGWSSAREAGTVDRGKRSLAVRCGSG